MSALASLALWRSQLQQGQQHLRQQFERDANTVRLIHQQCKLVDRILGNLWETIAIPQEICLVAVGGFGRGELFPFSDVDLLILLPRQQDAILIVQLEQLVGLMWDVGLTIGHSVRTIDECVAEAANDVTIRTSLLEARLLRGNRILYRRFTQALASAMDSQGFLKAKINEQAMRHARFHDTAYKLEPNIKESPGGLRDLQSVLWIARGLGIADSWNGLVRAGLITPAEAKRIRRHELALQTLRVRLHYLANRREDRLLFDFQNALAAQLGFHDHAKWRASEQLMQHYYRSARFVGLMNEILLQTLREQAIPQPGITQELNQQFLARNGLLEAKSPTLLQQRPAAILEAFLTLQQHPELKGISVGLVRNLLRVMNLVNSDFRREPRHKHLFMDILRQPSGITSTMKRMHRYGFLGRYLPAFGRITGQMQHDLFHAYTVDEHTLNVLRNLRRFDISQHMHEFPLCSKLIAEFPRKEDLYLAVLFHDIAKGRGGNHSELGSLEARRFCKSHGLEREDADLVGWLVNNHLLMSRTAQKSDLSDPAVIETFANLMGSERRLVALYLLTVADIRGTSPDVWNAWKSRLLENLFLAARRYLRSGGEAVFAEPLERQQQARAILGRYAIMEPDYQALWGKLGEAYFLRHESQEIAWHTRLLLTHLTTTKPIVRAHLSPGGDGIQVMIYTLDRDGLFACICGFFESIGYTIVEAKVHTTSHGYALDSFLVLDESDRSVRYRDLLSYIEYELAQRLESIHPPEESSHGRVSRQVKHFPIKPEVSISPAEKDNNHVLSIVASDRPGLLSRIAHAFLRLGISLHTARINTLGNRAEDIFLISARGGEPLPASTLEELKAELLEVL